MLDTAVQEVGKQGGAWLTDALKRARDKREKRMAHLVKDAGLVLALARGIDSELRSFLSSYRMYDTSRLDEDQLRGLVQEMQTIVDSRAATTAIRQAVAGIEAMTSAPKSDPLAAAFKGKKSAPEGDRKAALMALSITENVTRWLQLVLGQKVSLAVALQHQWALTHRQVSRHRQVHRTSGTPETDPNTVELKVAELRVKQAAAEQFLIEADHSFGRLRAWLIEQTTIKPPDWATGL